MRTEFSRSFPIETETTGEERVDVIAILRHHNRYWRLAFLALLGTTALLGTVVYKLGNRPPERIVLRINEAGEPSLGTYQDLQFHPRERDLRGYLIRFTELYYSRLRSTAERDYKRSLAFLPRPLAQARINDKEFQSWLSDINAPERDVYVTKVVFDEAENQPFKAKVEFDLVYRSQERVTKTENYTATYVFVMLTEPEELQKMQTDVNPLAFSMVHIRLDGAQSN